MSRRVLLIGAGTGPANNLIRSLRAGDPSLVIVGCHSDRFVLKQSSADRNYLMYDATHVAFAEGLSRIVDAEEIDVLMPTSDADVRAVAALREQLRCRLFLPRPSTIELCQDKYALAAVLGERGLPVPAGFPVTSLEAIDSIFERLPAAVPVWCRMRHGQGGMGAILVKNPAQARSWIKLWQDLRDISPAAFMLAEYLPGRDIAAQTLWNRGTLVLIKTYERLSYLGAANPRGLSSIAALSKTVFDPRLPEICAAAIRAIDPEASGVFVFDFKETAHGMPCITEINAGRFGMSTNIFDLPGKHNMASIFLQLALGEPVDISDRYDMAEDYYMVRDVDTTPGVYHSEEFFGGIEDARR